MNFNEFISSLVTQKPVVIYEEYENSSDILFNQIIKSAYKSSGLTNIVTTFMQYKRT